MSRLHLLRHADAGDSEGWDGPDATRPLTEKGRDQAARLGRFLAEHRFETDLILTSPKVRAAQTAEIVAAHLSMPVVVDQRLGGSLDLGLVEAILGEHQDPTHPVLVGHDPDFSDLIAMLTGSPAIPMRKGAMLRVDGERPWRAGGGVLRWLVPPQLLGREG